MSTNGLERQSVSVRIRTIVWTTRLVVKILNWFEAKRIKFFFICSLPRSSPLFTLAIHSPLNRCVCFSSCSVRCVLWLLFHLILSWDKIAYHQCDQIVILFFNIWQFTKIKICTIGKCLAKFGWKCCQILNKPSKSSPRFLKCSQSG